MSRKVYRVLPLGEKSWKVEINKRVVSKHRDKDNAISEAKRKAKGQQPSQVVIHKRNGRIQTEYTYKNDPRRTKG